ncbi:hypothetical protein KY325_04280 [Candidatus Woesearchaeota archaeon]|nr:hypothetical protein [Candidatus Woesearchaeota archaeon]MBW3018352.1 hypothetical protein [Candidatus Woesearchaeota archaeon]
MVELVTSGSFKQTMQELKQELDEHLSAINENTDEIEMNYSYLLELDKRMKFLEAKINLIEKMLLGDEKITQKTKKIKISPQEQEVFMVFYQTNKALDYKELTSRLKRSETYVRYCINGLLEKGVPITKHVINKRTFFVLDPAFKELQAKNNILNIEKTLTLDCFDQSIVDTN